MHCAYLEESGDAESSRPEEKGPLTRSRKKENHDSGTSSPGQFTDVASRSVGLKPHSLGGQWAFSKIPSIFEHTGRNFSTIESNYHKSNLSLTIRDLATAFSPALGIHVYKNVPSLCYILKGVDYLSSK